MLPENTHINKLSVLLSVVLFLCANISFAQSLTGSVSGNFVPLNGAVVKNISKTKATMSDVNGNFKINAISGDTLTVGFMGFKTDTLKVKQQAFLVFTLQPLTQLLGEVNISSNRLSPLAQFRKNQEDYKQIYRIGDNTHVFSASGDYRRIGVGLNIDALYSNFSKQGKDARRLQKVFVKDYYNDIVDTRFTKNLVNRITGYQGKQLDDFMADNRPSYEFIQSATDYDIIQFIQRRTRGILLQTDNPTAKKTKDKFKITFKNPPIKTAPGLGIR